MIGCVIKTVQYNRQAMLVDGGIKFALIYGSILSTKMGYHIIIP